MGNASGKGEIGADGSEDPLGKSQCSDSAAGGVPSLDSIANSPPSSPRITRSPLLFAPQVPVAPLHRGDGGSPFPNQPWLQESHGADHNPPEQGLPVIITWNHGGNEVVVEGSWDNWTSRKTLNRSGKDHSILLVLQSGIYRYKFLVDGERRYIPDLPFISDESCHVCNLLKVHDYVPENLDSVAEFEAPSSPESTYSQAFLADEDYAKEPQMAPSQLHLTVLDMDKDNEDETSSSKPHHVVLNHLFIEKGWVTQSVVALGMTHRFQSKYVTVVLYKPLQR